MYRVGDTVKFGWLEHSYEGEIVQEYPNSLSFDITNVFTGTKYFIKSSEIKELVKKSNLRGIKLSFDILILLIEELPRPGTIYFKESKTNVNEFIVYSNQSMLTYNIDYNEITSCDPTWESGIKSFINKGLIYTRVVEKYPYLK